MKILWKGNVFNPTGLATANRELCKALHKLGVKIQTTDPWRSQWEFTKGLEHLNNPIDVSENTITIFADYPQAWREGHGRLVGLFLHEGTRLMPGWSDLMNRVERIIVPAESVKNLFRWNGVERDIEVIPFGVSEMYQPKSREKNKDFAFLSVNSWTGNIGDRKGTELLIKAFDEEFKNERVKLILKISTFWQDPIDYQKAVNDVLGHVNKNIYLNSEYMPESELVKIYQNADCFVSPTRGEGFGLTILNAMACGLPVIVTKDINAGHMDFCKGVASVLWIDAPSVLQGDRRFYAEGNMLAEPDLESLKKQMRYAYENRSLRNWAIKNSEQIRKDWSWSESARKLIEVLNES